MIAGVCRICRCTDEAPCFFTKRGVIFSSAIVDMLRDEQLDQVELYPCYWVEPDLCSACVLSPAPAPLLYDAQGNPLRGAP